MAPGLRVLLLFHSMGQYGFWAELHVLSPLLSLRKWSVAWLLGRCWVACQSAVNLCCSFASLFRRLCVCVCVCARLSYQRLPSCGSSSCAVVLCSAVAVQARVLKRTCIQCTCMCYVNCYLLYYEYCKSETTSTVTIRGYIKAV